MEEKAFSVEVLGKKIPVLFVSSSETAFSSLSILVEKNCLFGVDIETAPALGFAHDKEAGLSPHLSSIRLLQIYDGDTCYVFDIHKVPFKIFIPFLENKRFIAHNALFELANFMKNGVRQCNIGCTYILSKLLSHAIYPTDSGLTASLGALVKLFFKVELNKDLQVSTWGSELTYEQIEYACLDAIYVKLLGEELAKGIEKYDLWNSYQILKDVQYPTACMHLYGMEVDVPYHRELIEVWREELFHARKELLDITGLGEVTAATIGGWLEENLPPDVLATWPETSEDSGKLSTAASTLADYEYLEIVKPFSEFQKRAKLVSTYGMGMLNRINPVSGRLHTQYNICGARTGRWSSSKINLQNLPRDASVRRTFKAPEGYVYMCADYSQIEVRIIAELSQDKALLQAFKEGRDVYQHVASLILNKRYEDVTSEERKRIKPVVLGRMYGLGSKNFCGYAKRSYKLEYTEQEGIDFIEGFKEMFSGITDFQRAQAEYGGMYFTSRTPMGKLRKLDPNKYYGAALNTPIQGAAAEVLNMALIRLGKYFPYGGKCQLICQVHDEIDSYVPNNEADIQYTKSIIEREMTLGFLDVLPNAITNNLVNIQYGPTWADAK